MEKKTVTKTPAPKQVKKNKSAYVLSSKNINVLLMGTSGAGKSTLINAVIPGANAPTGDGRAVTTEMRPYSEPDNPLVLIDSVGYEFNILRQIGLKREISKWSLSGVKGEDASKLIHLIWFCIDGQNRRVFDEVLNSIRNVSMLWKDIPIIVVFTKSFGTEEDDSRNVQMFLEVLSTYKHRKDLNIKDCDIIPVVAKEYETPTGTVRIKGLDRLVERTIELIPEAQKNAQKAVKEIELRLKRAEANALVGASVAGASVVGAIPIDIHDSAILMPLQSVMLGGIGKIYNISDKNAANQIIDAALKAGGTTLVGKTLVNKLKNIPAINIAADVINAVVAGVITGIVGEVSVIVFEKVERGEIPVTGDTDWVRIVTDLINGKMPDFVGTVVDAVKGKNKKEIPQALLTAFTEIVNRKIKSE